MWDSNKLVKEFLKFFEERGHRIVESSPLVPNDKTLLFTSAGMVQFKPLWSGEVPLEFKRAASVQKCLRLSDLTEVGKTFFHDTFFEMLGNFSFGDYFKEETISWGWEFLTKVLKIPEERLYVSVHTEDSEAYEIWKEKIKVPENKIIKRDDNFWGPAGGKGPCGPDTEIFYDMGEEFGDCKFDGECHRYIELWNHVFPQYDEREDGRHPLKNRGVDTGMGLERLAMVMQGKPSIFETDLFFPIIEKIEELTNVKYKEAKEVFHIVADHSRALVFAISEGVYPGNTGRGYVLRRLVRRALTGLRKINVEEPILNKLVPTVTYIMKNRYPYLKEKIDQVTLIIKREEENFINTLSSGISILTQLINDAKEKRLGKIDGKDVFRLYDTYGFPPDLTKEIAEEENLTIDEEGFHKEMEKQRERAREKHIFLAEEKAEWEIVNEGSSIFVGYEKEEISTEILAFRKGEKNFELILKETPFYGESGGQVGDTGIIEGLGWKLTVENTIPSNLGNIHLGKLEGSFNISQVKAIIDVERRNAIRRNHTTTHILHKVLKKVLGDWVHQEGSYVGPDRFRFDFTHPEPLRKEEIKLIEEEVNKIIFKEMEVKTEILPLKEAINRGAIALFTEEYGETVRMVSIGDFSKELCGGTHLHNTIEAGLFKIISEGSVASGIRRIEGITGLSTYKWIKETEEIVEEIEFLLDVERKNLPKRIEKIMATIKEQRKEIERRDEEAIELKFKELLKIISDLGNYKLIATQVEGNREFLRKLGEKLRKSMPNGIGLLTSKIDSSFFAILFVGEDLKDKLNAAELLKEVCKIAEGSGGGNRERAEGGGKNAQKIPEMLNKFKEILKKEIK
ncbi:MAG: alanine--tRNA ligase [candidate division WOR-3 bacterium]